MADPKVFKFTIPSDTSEGQAVQEKIIELLEARNFTERDLFGIRLALEEAIVNAIKHGNRMSRDKQVHIRCIVQADTVRIEIEDEGEGFDPADVPDPTAEENLDKPCGRGIMLMKAFLNTVAYNEQGNCVILEKTREE